MAKFIFVLLFMATLQVGARGIGQSMTASFSNAGLNEVFREVEKQTGYTFVFSKVQMQQASKVTALFKGTPLAQALKEIFRDQPFTYQVSDKFIVVQQKSAEGMSASLNSAMAPPDVVKGKVTDEGGSPVAGAIVMVKGTHIQTATNERGEFMLKDITADATLVISAINIETKEVPLKGRTDITLVTKAKIFALEEVSIGGYNYGYGSVSKERAAGAATKVTDSALAITPTISLVTRLEGMVPGLKVDTKNNKLQVRTTNTYSTTSEPLIVIDGFPQVPVGDQQKLSGIQGGNVANNALFSYINPNDIESITILKDASAASIWGAKGANGVIVIETKKGKKGTNAVNFSTNVGVSKPADLNKLRWMTSAQYVNLEQELVDRGIYIDPLAYGAPSVYTANNSEATEWMYKYKRGSITQAVRDSALAVIGGRSNTQQIKDYLLQSAVSQQYNLSVSGGNDNNTYYVSAAYTKDRPVFRSNLAQSASVTANFSSNLIKNKLVFRMGMNYMYAVSKTNSAASDALNVSTTALRPYDMLVDANGNTIKRNIIMRSELIDPLVAKGYLPFGYNAVDELNYSNTVGKENRVRVNMGLTYKFASWLNMEVYGMYQNYANNQKSLNELNSYSSRILVNTGTTVVSNKLVYGVPKGGVYILNDASGYDYNTRAQLNFNKRIKGDHSVTALAAAEIRETYSKSYGATRYGFNSETNTAVTINPKDYYNTMYGYSMQLSDPLGSISESRNRYLSYLGNFSYAFQDKYVATGSMRFDDYTLLGLDRSKRAKPFWSAGLRWNASREKFMHDVRFLNDVNVRLSYGTGGSVPLAGTNVTLISISGTDSRTQQTYGSIQTPANQGLGWELTKTLNGGVGFNVFKSRLTVNLDVYQKWSSGILNSLPYNATYGWSQLYFNTSTLSSHGIDLGLSGDVIRSKNFRWNAMFNFSYGTNKVTDSRYASNAATLVPGGNPVQGLPMGYMFVYKWAGLDNTGQSQIYDRDKNIIKSTSGLPSTFTWADIKYAGVTVAPYYGGFAHSFRYKSFELGVRMAYYFGHVFLRQSVDNYPNYVGYSGVLDRNADLATRWRNPGDEAKTNVPGLANITYNSWLRYKYSDALVEKADNIRLQQISISYNVPMELLPKGVFKSLSISANARNLGLIWAANKKGIDPEYLNTNNFSNLPPAKSFVFGLNASF